MFENISTDLNLFEFRFKGVVRGGSGKNKTRLCGFDGNKQDR